MSVYPSALPTVRPAVRSAFEQGSGGGAASIIAGLFAQGQQGFWLPFTDFASLSQDSAGTLPYTALEQPVGLIYDKSRGGALGPELVLNGDFDTGSSWSTGAGIAISDGKWRATDAPAANPSSLQNTGASVSGMVKVTLIVSGYVSGVVWLRLYTPSGVAADTPSISKNGTYSFLLQTNGWDGRIGLRGNGGTTLAVDSVSIKQVLGNHATQPTSAARGAVSARVNQYLETEDIARAKWTKLNTTASTETSPFENAGVTKLTSQAATAMTGFSFFAALSGMQRWELSAKGIDGCRYLAFAVNQYKEYSFTFDLQNGTITQSPTLGAATAQITAGVDGFWDIVVFQTGSNVQPRWLLSDTPTLNNNTTTFVGDGVKAILVAKPQTSMVLEANRYQRVNTPTDYDAVGFPKYLRLDGVDDNYTCGGGGSTTGFYYSDVIRPMGGAGTRRVIWSDRSGNSGYELAINTANKLEFSAGNGTTITTVETTQLAALAEGKRYEVMDDGAVLSLQIDGSAPVTVARPVVTAGSSTITLYRGASTGYLNGQITEPIYRAGPPPSDYERGVIRAYQMQKAGL